MSRLRFDSNVYALARCIVEGLVSMTVPAASSNGASTRAFRIAVIPGDGIGNEVVPEGLKVLDALATHSGGRFSFDYEHFPWGCEYYLKTGRMMDEDALERLTAFDAIYFGAVGWPDVPDHISLWGLRLAICQGFDQYACVRPVKLLPGIESPLRGATARDDRLGRRARERRG